MARAPKPWYRKDRKSWFVTIDGERHNLGPDRAAAKEQFHELMLRPLPRRASPQSVVGVIDAFLDWCQKHKAHDTYQWYVRRTQSFVSSVPATLTIREFKPIHVTRWIDSHSTWNDGTKRGSMIAVQRAMNWAVKQGVIEKSPIAYLEKPQAGRRERVVYLSETALAITKRLMLKNADGPVFRNVDARSGVCPFQQRF